MGKDIEARTEIDGQRAAADANLSSSAGEPSHQLQPGQEIAGYRIEAVLGVGGMGEVYRATQKRMDRQVALKVLAPGLAADAEFRRRFVREAQQAGRLSHPHLLMVYDVIQHDGLLAFAMELADGEDLAGLIDRQGQLPEAEAERLLRPVLKALAYIHQQGLVHRDVKPDNIIVGHDGQVKLADMGLAATMLEAEDQRLTQSGVMMGTPAYMPPEQARDARHVDARADIYAWAATAYHAVAGRPPHVGVSAVDVVLKASHEPVQMPTARLSRTWQRMLRHALAADPEDRPGSIAELAALIDGGTVAQPQLSPGRRQSIVLAALAAAAGLILAAVLWWPQDDLVREPASDGLTEPAAPEFNTLPPLNDRAVEPDPANTTTTPEPAATVNPIDSVVAISRAIRRWQQLTGSRQVHEMGEHSYRLRGNGSLRLVTESLPPRGQVRLQLKSNEGGLLFIIRPGIVREEGIILSHDQRGRQHVASLAAVVQLVVRDGERMARKPGPLWERLGKLRHIGQPAKHLTIDLRWSDGLVELTHGDVSTATSIDDILCEWQWHSRVRPSAVEIEVLPLVLEQ